MRPVAYIPTARPMGNMRTGYAVPVCDRASSILSRQEKDALWEGFFTAAPARRLVELGTRLTHLREFPNRIVFLVPEQ